MPKPRRKPTRRRKGSEAWIVALLLLALIAGIVRWLADHPIAVAVLALAIAVAAGGLIAREVSRRRAARRQMAERVGISHYLLMSPTEFEHAVAWLCRRDGCRGVEVVGGAGDLGADVVATTPTGRRIVIQAKRYAPSNRVGSPELQKVGGTARQVHGAELVAAVTTSEFTRAAREYAAHPGVDIRLFDQVALGRWAAGTGPAPWH